MDVNKLVAKVGGQEEFERRIKKGLVHVGTRDLKDPLAPAREFRADLLTQWGYVLKLPEGVFVTSGGVVEIPDGNGARRVQLPANAYGVEWATLDTPAVMLAAERWAENFWQNADPRARCVFEDFCAAMLEENAVSRGTARKFWSKRPARFRKNGRPRKR